LRVLCDLCGLESQKLLTAEFTEDLQKIAEKMSPKTKSSFPEIGKEAQEVLENSSIPNLMSPVLSGSRVGTWRPG